jgi:hypothetical protein
MDLPNTNNVIKSTIVSAFVSDVNFRKDRNLQKYFDLGKLLINCDVPKIIFLDECMYKYFVENMGKTIVSNTNTRIYKINKRDSYLYKYEKYLKNFQLNTDNSDKDTLDFMFTMCNKTEWIKKAIMLNDFNTSNYIWLDFGIRHVFKCSDEDFIYKVNKLKYIEYDNIRIASIWKNMQDYSWYNEDYDIYKKIMWFFAGGVFGGNKNALLTFSDKMKEKCMEIMLIKGTIMWEVNVWYLIYKECNELFSRYWCDHNITIIDNY